MLVLQRRAGESIIIDGNIRVTIYPHPSGRKQYSVHIDAPRSVTVDREEIHIRKQESGK